MKKLENKFFSMEIIHGDGMAELTKELIVKDDRKVGGRFETLSRSESEFFYRGEKISKSYCNTPRIIKRLYSYRGAGEWDRTEIESSEMGDNKYDRLDKLLSEAGL